MTIVALETSCDDTCAAIIDARRGEVFVAAYERGGAGLAPRELLGPQALALERLGDVLESSRSAGRTQASWLALGDGAVRYRAEVERTGIPSPPPDSPLHRVSAAAICLLALEATSPAGGTLLPDYRRRPDAELALEGAAAGAQP